MEIGLLIEKLMQHFTQGIFSSEGEVAKRQFIKWTSDFDEMSDEFESKMAQFTDWYLFTRPMPPFNIPPIQLSPEKSGFIITQDLEKSYGCLISSCHSLFEFLKLKKEHVYIRDIFSQSKLIVKDSPITNGFEKGGVFEARVIPSDDSFIFSDSFCFHPLPVTRYILSCSKSIRKLEASEQEVARAQLIHKLFRMYNRLDYYKHIPTKEIYTDNFMKNTYGD